MIEQLINQDTVDNLNRNICLSAYNIYNTYIICETKSKNEENNNKCQELALGRICLRHDSPLHPWLR